MQSYDKNFLMEVLENLWTVRKFEECAKDSFLKGEIKGNVHVCLGEEGAVVGANMALKPSDYIAVSHRGHGHCVMKSKDVDHAMAELFGKETGFCHGRGGSMHVTKLESGLLGANGIVGGGIPLATGSALTSKIDGDGAVSVSFFGDGATNQGCFHECMNMAAAWKLPIVYFIEDNQYAVSVNIHTVVNTETLAQRAQGYGIPGVVVDGTDVLAVYEAMSTAVERARNGEGPTLIDCNVYRFTGHYVGDPAAYMSEQYLKEAHEKDVIEKFKAKLLEEKVATAEEMDALEAKVAAKIDEAKKFAVESPAPDKSGVLDYNYSMDNERSVAR
jgi:Pyruvate/2-oxoglutarate dehydrogenase complex, dehydrogenase (E1) component, eukaryotic type, alpha subunit